MLSVNTWICSGSDEERDLICLGLNWSCACVCVCVFTGEKKAKEEQAKKLQAKKSKMKVWAAASSPALTLLVRFGCAARLLANGISFLIGVVLLLGAFVW